MYAFSVVLFPQYILFMLKSWYKNNQFLNFLYEQVQLDHILGVILLLISLVLLTYGFAYVNIDYKEIADNLKKVEITLITSIQEKIQSAIFFITSLAWPEFQPHSTV